MTNNRFILPILSWIRALAGVPASVKNLLNLIKIRNY